MDKQILDRRNRHIGDFSGKVVLISGAGRGLGREMAKAFSAQGAIVALNDLTPVNLDTTLDNIHAAGDDRVARQYLFDVAIQMQCRVMVAEVLADWGRLDILVNAARVKPHSLILDIDEWDWRRTLDVNLSGAFFLTQSAGRAMADQGGGVIVNFGETVMNGEGDPAGDLLGQSAYQASQLGLQAFTRVAARELAVHGVRVVMVTSPYFHHRTEMIDKALFLCSDSGIHQKGTIFDVRET